MAYGVSTHPTDDLSYRHSNTSILPMDASLLTSWHELLVVLSNSNDRGATKHLNAMDTKPKHKVNNSNFLNLSSATSIETTNWLYGNNVFVWKVNWILFQMVKNGLSNFFFETMLFRIP